LDDGKGDYQSHGYVDVILPYLVFSFMESKQTRLVFGVAVVEVGQRELDDYCVTQDRAAARVRLMGFGEFLQ
jgi:hypothetical protein